MLLTIQQCLTTTKISTNLDPVITHLAPMVTLCQIAAFFSKRSCNELRTLTDTINQYIQNFDGSTFHSYQFNLLSVLYGFIEETSASCILVKIAQKRFAWILKNCLHHKIPPTFSPNDYRLFAQAQSTNIFKAHHCKKHIICKKIITASYILS